MKISQMRRDAIYALRDTRYTYRSTGDPVLETRAMIPLDLERPARANRPWDKPGAQATIRLGGSRLGNPYVAFVGDFDTLRAHARQLRAFTFDDFLGRPPAYREKDLPDGVRLGDFETNKVTGLWEDWAPIAEEIEDERARRAAVEAARVARDTALQSPIRDVMERLHIEDNGRSGVSVNVERDEVRLNVGTLALLLGLNPEPLTDDELHRAGEFVPQRPSLKAAIRGRGHGY